YGIRKKDENAPAAGQDCEGRIGAIKRKSPEELAKEGEQDETLMGQLNSAFDKAKVTATGESDVSKMYIFCIQ
uniref:Uncharacterized protein n=1 Tax=Romanomermis culicivorax TaxID=13658 RepID=A0A915L261_ROMCU